MKKNIVVFITAFALIFTTAFAVLATDTYAATPKPKKIYLTTTSSTVDIKGKVYVKVSAVSPSNASKSVKWKSSNTKIATVSSKGTVYGKKTGSVYITATSTKSKSVKKSIKIYVKNLKPTSITLDKDRMELYEGQKGSLKVTKISPTGLYDYGVRWSSTDNDVAKLSGSSYSPTVNALGVGEATLKVQTKESSREATCNVLVKKLAFENPSNKTVRITSAPYSNPASITPASAENRTVTYSSSDERVATVDEDGTVTPEGAGVTEITATADEDTTVKVSYEFEVRSSLIYPKQADNDYVFDLDKAGYSKFKVNGYRLATSEFFDYIVDEDAVKNAFGEDGVNVWNGNSVKNDFLGSSFSFITGDYEVSKAANDGVRVKYKNANGTIMPSYWYYRDDEFANSMEGFDSENPGTYTLTLFSIQEGDVDEDDVLVVNLANSEITFTINGKIVSIKNVSNNSLILDVKEGDEPRINFTFEKNGSDAYKLIVPVDYVVEYEVQVIPWEKR